MSLLAVYGFRRRYAYLELANGAGETWRSVNAEVVHQRVDVLELPFAENTDHFLRLTCVVTNKQVISQHNRGASVKVTA